MSVCSNICILQIVGGEGVNVTQPSWSPSGELYFVSDTTAGNSYWSLYRADMSGVGNHSKVLGEDNHEIFSLGWLFNFNSYAFNPDNSKEISIAYKGVSFCLSVGLSSSISFFQELQILDTDTSKLTVIPTGLPCHSRIVYSSDGHILTIGEGPTAFPSVLRINPVSGKVETICSSRKPFEDLEYISIGRNITFETTENDHAHAIYYAPKVQTI